MDQTQPSRPVDPPAPTTQPKPTPVVAQPEPEKDLYIWNAPSRLYKKRNREFYTTILALVILLSVILLLAKEFLLIAVILSFGFLSYVLASVEPGKIPHKLTNKGVRTHDKLYLWNICIRYWWELKWGQKLLHIEHAGKFPHKIILLLGDGDAKHIESIVSKYVVKEKPDPSWVDKSATWLQEKVPQDHDWEMERVVWLPFKEALEKLAFSGEKQALAKAQQLLS